MRVQWYGQSAFSLTAGSMTVAIDPFYELHGLEERGMTFDYPAIEGVEAELLLVTHEHMDHNGIEAIDGDPLIIRSTAGRLHSPVGEVVAIASEHDAQAGTQRGPNTIFVFELDGLRVCHFGDFGQSTLRDEQASAIGAVDLLIIPVGDGPTIGAGQAHAIVNRLAPRWVVPMHYRTPRVSFLDTADAFLDLAPAAHHCEQPSFETAALPAGERPLVVVPAVP